jgi:hypothetical protein
VQAILSVYQTKSVVKEQLTFDIFSSKVDVLAAAPENLNCAAIKLVLGLAICCWLNLDLCKALSDY